MSDVLNVPVGIVSAAYGGAKVESWTPRDMLEKYPDISLDPKDIEPMVHYHRPMLMYNAMFNPIKNYTYNGIIWYVERSVALCQRDSEKSDISCFVA